MIGLLDAPLPMIDGTTSSLRALADGGRVLVVNVASACGLTRQYDGLQRLHASADDLTVVGVPCNQFGGQEPGSHEEICAFTDERFGVTFPLTAKLEVNGPGRHPIYSILTTTADSTGHEGDIRWNFEKFLIDPDGSVVRFAPATPPGELL